MTPAEHYTEAESAIEAAIKCMTPPGISWIEANSLVALAGVHARLAAVDPEKVWPLRGFEDPKAQFVEHVYMPPVGLCVTCGLSRSQPIHVDPGSKP